MKQDTDVLTMESLELEAPDRWVDRQAVAELHRLGDLEWLGPHAKLRAVVAGRDSCCPGSPAACLKDKSDMSKNNTNAY